MSWDERHHADARLPARPETLEDEQTVPTNVIITITASPSEPQEPPGAEPPEPPDPTATAEAAKLPPETAAVTMPLPPDPAAVPEPAVLQILHPPHAHMPPRTRLEARATIMVGGFGVVRLVCDPVSRLRYALKEVRKAHILQHCPKTRVKWLLREKQTLEELSHPFIVTLIGTYESTGHVYFLMELLRGGELLNLMQHMGCALENTHNQNHMLITCKPPARQHTTGSSRSHPFQARLRGNGAVLHWMRSDRARLHAPAG